MRSTEEMKMCEDDDIGRQLAKVKSYVSSLYHVQDKVKGLLNGRRAAVTDLCLQECKEMWNGVDVKDKYKPYNRVMFMKHAAEYMDKTNKETVWSAICVGVLKMDKDTVESAKNCLNAYVQERLNEDLKVYDAKLGGVKTEPSDEGE
jgi:hypothetical protein